MIIRGVRRGENKIYKLILGSFDESKLMARYRYSLFVFNYDIDPYISFVNPYLLSLYYADCINRTLYLCLH